MNQPLDHKPTAPRDDHPRSEDHNPSLAGQFVREILMFLIGLFLGFFWYAYSRASDSPETHIIIGLIVIIIGLVRYVVLLHGQHGK